MPDKFEMIGLNGSLPCLCVELKGGARLDRTAMELAAVATALDREVSVDHNGRKMTAKPGQTGKEVYSAFRADHPAPGEWLRGVSP